jgi:pimeloyl-ACP methyl ester carboxylesterase
VPAAVARSTRPRRRALASLAVFAPALGAAVGATLFATTCWAGHASRTALTPAAARVRDRSAPTQIISGTFIAEGVSLPYLRQGRGDVVVILPDSAERLNEWRPQIAALGERFLAVTYLRTADPETEAANASNEGPSVPIAGIGVGSGRDGTPTTRSQRDSRQLRELLMFVSWLTPGEVHVVGEGEGARLALRFALEAPDRVRSLVLSAPDARWIATDPEIMASRAGTSIRGTADTLLACRRLWQIHAQALVLCGEHDWRTFGDTPPLRCVRNLREQVLRGAALRPHAQAPQDFNRAVARFLERQRMTAGEP